MNRILAESRFRLRALIAPHRVRQEIDAELEAHLEMHERDLVASGMPAREARLIARQELGPESRIREICRSAALVTGGKSPRKGPADMITQDALYALRSLIRRPGFTAVAALTLALGIAVTTAIFSVVYGIALSPLPFPEQERLVVPAATMIARGGQPISVTYPEYLEWRKRGDLFESVAVVSATSRDLSGDGEPERIRGALVSPEFFDVYRARPLEGRLFSAVDFTDGNERVAVLGAGLWQRRFGSDPDIVGQEIRLSDVSYTVIGVVDEQDVWPAGTAVWAPMFYGEPLPDWVMDWDNFFLRAVARLQPGVSPAATQSALVSMAERWAQDMPELREGYGARVVRMQHWVVGDEARTIFLVLLCAVGFVLLIACVNVANLLLARGMERDRETAVRRALGASRGDLFRQALFESVILATIGGAVGVGLATAMVRVLVATLPAETPRLADVGVSGDVLLFAALTSIAAALIFGILPALRLGRGELTEALGESSRGATRGASTRRARSALVVAEIALSMALLVAAGMMLRSIDGLLDRDAGMQLDNGLAVQLSLPAARYPDDAASDRFYRDMIERLHSLPEVRGATAVSTMPLVGGGLSRVHLEEGKPQPPDGPEFRAQWNVVTPEFFSTAGVPVQLGRVFDDDDTTDSEPVIVVSESFAREMFPNESPIGKRIRSWRDEDLLRTVIGVVGDVRMAGMSADFNSLVYVSTWQSAIRPSGLLLRTEGDPLAIASRARQTIWNADPDLPIANMLTLRQLAQRSVNVISMGGRLMGLFATLALGLAATGLYGLMSYSVVQRSREYGIRIALGARDQVVVWEVCRSALELGGIGLAVGLALAVALSRVLTSALFGVASTDLGSLGVVTVTMLLVTLAAAIIPARRATRMDPVETLRVE